MISAVILVIITVFVPPIGVFIISGCGADFLINILLCLLGYFPAHIHAFYLEYIYYHRKEARRTGIQPDIHQGVYSQKQDPVVGAGAMQGYGQQVPQQQGYPQQAYIAPQQAYVAPQQGVYAGQESGVEWRKGNV